MGMPIYVATTHTVKPGQEQDFENAAFTFFSAALGDTATDGALLIRPLPGAENRTYGILRSFASEQDRKNFYESDKFAQLQQAINPYVEEDCSRRELHGLEAFFYDPSIINQPPRWKMAIVTWFGVWPTVYVVSNLARSHVSGWPSFLATGFVTFLVVLALAWGVMPTLTRLLRPWLLESADIPRRD